MGPGLGYVWSRIGGRIAVSFRDAHVELDVGPGSEAQVAVVGLVAVVDRRELVMLERTGEDSLRVARRVTLPGDSLEVVSTSFEDYALVHVPGAVLRFSRADESRDARLDVGEGYLLPGAETDDAITGPTWWDSRGAHTVEFRTELAILPAAASTPEEVAVVGRPIAAPFDVVIGERGFGSTLEGVPGPRSVSAESLYGPGRITLVNAYGTSFVYEHEDGRRSIRTIAYGNYCGP